MKTNIKNINLFTVRAFLFLLPIGLLHVWAVIVADGTTDEFYNKIATPKQKALILGTSRAEQCMVPDEFDSVLKAHQMNFSVFNFAFNLSISPYGQTYLEAVKKKADASVRNGLFILCVDPWTISIERNNSDDEKGQSENSPGNQYLLRSVSAHPNLEYFLKKYPNGWGQILINKYFPNSYMYLHPNGWVEISTSMDSALTATRTRNRVKIYRNEYLLKYKPSVSRFKSLEETIKFCRYYGKVVLVRIPACKEIYEIEQHYLPEFDDRMQHLAKKYNCPYLNYGSDGYKYIYMDGNHMYKESGKVFSRKVAEDIVKSAAEH